MKKLFLLLAVFAVAFVSVAADLTIRNSSPKMLDMSCENGVYTMSLKPFDGYDTDASVRHRGFKKSTGYEFSCDIDSVARAAVYLQVKLFKNGKELARKTSSDNRKYKERLRLDFDTRDADKISLLIRIHNRPFLVGKTVKVSNIYFGEPTVVKAAALPRIMTVPGFNAASIYLSNMSAQRADDCKIGVKYRKAGEENWKNGLDLVYDESRKQARGSLLGLDENTAYEYVLDVEENGKRECVSGKFTTRNSDFPVAKKIVLTPENAQKLLRNVECGSEKGYVLYTSKPGVVLDFGVKKSYAVNLAGASYIILDGLTIKGGLQHAINIEYASDVVIRNCDI